MQLMSNVRRHATSSAIRGGLVMPMKISYRQSYEDSSFRDVILESLHSHPSGSVYIAAGFFSDFLLKKQKDAPHHNLLDAMKGKRVYLYGLYDKRRDKSSMISFRDTLVKNEIPARAFLCAEKWHAKTLFFYSENKPLLAIVGSSNATGPSFSGRDPFGIWRGKPKHTVECDTYLWTSPVGSAVANAFSGGASCQIPSSVLPDHEIEQMIDGLLNELQKFNWEELA